MAARGADDRGEIREGRHVGVVRMRREIGGLGGRLVGVQGRREVSPPRVVEPAVGHAEQELLQSQVERRLVEQPVLRRRQPVAEADGAGARMRRRDREIIHVELQDDDPRPVLEPVVFEGLELVAGIVGEDRQVDGLPGRIAAGQLPGDAGRIGAVLGDPEAESHGIPQPEQPAGGARRIVIDVAVAFVIEAVADVAVALRHDDPAVGMHLEAGAHRDDVVVERPGPTVEMVPHAQAGLPGDAGGGQREEEPPDGSTASAGPGTAARVGCRRRRASSRVGRHRGLGVAGAASVLPPRWLSASRAISMRASCMASAGVQTSSRTPGSRPRQRLIPG